MDLREFLKDELRKEVEKQRAISNLATALLTATIFLYIPSAIAAIFVVTRCVMEAKIIMPHDFITAFLFSSFIVLSIVWWLLFKR